MKKNNSFPSLYSLVLFVCLSLPLYNLYVLTNLIEADTYFQAKWKREENIYYFVCKYYLPFVYVFNVGLII